MSEQWSLFDDPPEFVGSVSIHPLYRVWTNMRQRCENSADKAFKDYGGRGIFVCDEWRNSPRAFVAWAINSGWQPGLEIDRENNDGPYSPGNCRFVTRAININNRRNTRRLKDGTPMSDAVRAAGMKYLNVDQRTRRGLSLDDAIYSPRLRKGPAPRRLLKDGTAVADCIKAKGLSANLVYSRIMRGWSPDDAVTVPKGGKRPAASAPSIPRGLVDLPAVDLPRPVYDPGYPAAYLSKGIEND